jgi:hypothetical protein
MIGRLFKLAFAVAILAALYVFFRPEADGLLDAVRDRWNVLRRDTAAAQIVDQEAVSPRVAEAAERRIGRLGTESRRESFTTNELQSLLEHRYGPTLPEYVSAPRIALHQDEVTVSVRLPVAKLPRADELGQIIELLPDTTDLEMRGSVLPFDDGYIAFTVDAITAHRIPLPSRFIPALLDMFGREDVAGLPADAIRIPLPDGARSAYVRSDSLVVLSTGNR